MLRMAETSLRGYENLAGRTDRDGCLETRMNQFEEQVRHYRLIIPAISANAVNDRERTRAFELERRAAGIFPLSITDRAACLGARALAARWRLRLALFGDGIQPKTIKTRYAAGRGVAKEIPGSTIDGRRKRTELELPTAAAAFGATARSL
jgi:hypothetical protein